ncbi:unnamed protein product [Leuciscus chuanchicus]
MSNLGGFTPEEPVIEALITSTTTATSETGGWTTEAPVTDHLKKICLEMKPDIEKAVGTNFPVYIPISFRLQVEKGTNYVVKVYFGKDMCVHAMIFQDIQRKLTVLEARYPKALSDPLVPF